MHKYSKECPFFPRYSHRWVQSREPPAGGQIYEGSVQYAASAAQIHSNLGCGSSTGHLELLAPSPHTVPKIFNTKVSNTHGFNTSSKGPDPTFTGSKRHCHGGGLFFSPIRGQHKTMLTETQHPKSKVCCVSEGQQFVCVYYT